jgi:hypothetical protein
MMNGNMMTHKFLAKYSRIKQTCSQLWLDADASSLKVRVVNDGSISALLAIVMK